MTQQISPISPVLVGNLVSLAKAFAKAKTIKLETVGYNAAKEAEFFIRLESGESSCTLRKYDLLAAWFLSNWPEGVTMPTLKDTAHYPASHLFNEQRATPKLKVTNDQKEGRRSSVKAKGASKVKSSGKAQSGKGVRRKG